MYEVRGKYWIVRDGVKQPAAEPMYFRTAMGMLHWAVKSGMIRRRGAWGNTVPGIGELERVSIPYAGSGDWAGEHYFTTAQVSAMDHALARYRWLLRYLREVEPEWAEVPGSRVCYADNSVEVTQADKYGNTRRVMEVAPHGDVC